MGEFRWLIIFWFNPNTYHGLKGHPMKYEGYKYFGPKSASDYDQNLNILLEHSNYAIMNLSWISNSHKYKPQILSNEYRISLWESEHREILFPGMGLQGCQKMALILENRVMKILEKRYTVPWSGVGGNPPPLKDDLGWAVGLDGWWVWCKGWRVGRR